MGRLQQPGLGAPPQQPESEVAEIYEKYSAELLRYAEAWTHDPSTTRDAVQEIFLRYFVERTYGRRIDNPRGWLYRVLRNHLLDCGKAAAATREVASDDLDWVPDGAQNPEESLERTELAEEIAATLSNRELECVQLRSEGRGYLEISQRLGIRPGTVAALLSRVHTKLGSTGTKQHRGLAEAVSYLLVEGQSNAS